MRELKIRCWDKKKKKWLGVDRVHVLLMDGALWKPDVEFVEYTGRKDIKREEIYEGDIVSDCYKHPDKEIDWHYLGPSKKGKVVWDADHAGFYIETDRWEEEKISKIPPEHTSHQIISEWVEIIGNIYENPELLMEMRPQK